MEAKGPVLPLDGQVADVQSETVNDIAPGEPVVTLAPADPLTVASLRAHLAIDGCVAQALVRRGIGSVEAAREFLAGDQPIDPHHLPGAVDAVRLLARHIEAGTRIAVHGDYDADGACSTALLVEALSGAGAQVTWHVPDRFADGYGLGANALRRFADDGVGLCIAVDCGVTAIDEAEMAAGLGIDLLILDHHRPGELLPRALIVHPQLGEYPNPELCATAIAWKVMSLLYDELGADRTIVDNAIELVALATVTDVMPLTGENRAIVRRGVASMRTTRRPGLRELMRAAAVDPLAIDASTFGFRLGPRINAAGRMRSAEAAVELLLTTSEQRASQLADELHGLNALRQEIEQEVIWQAEQQAAQQLDGFAIVVAGEGWHKGVLGIVAGKLAERHRRPCVALSIAGDFAEGSGRNGGSFDLLTGLEACSDLLISFGGHRAAAGLRLEAADLAAFRDALRAQAAQQLQLDDLRPHYAVDAVTCVGAMTLETAEQLAALGPFGNANAEPLLLLADVDVGLVERMGGGRRHARLSVADRSRRARAVAWDWQSVKPAGSGPWHGHALAALRRNEWNGSVEAQVQVRAILPMGEGPAARSGDAAAWGELFALELAAPAPEAADVTGLIEAFSPEFIDRRGEPPLAAAAELAAGGSRVAVIVRHPSHWRGLSAALQAIGIDAETVCTVDFNELDHVDPGVAFVVADLPLQIRELHSLTLRDGAVIAAWDRSAAERELSRLEAAYCSRDFVAAFWRLFAGREEVAVEELPRLADAAGITWLDPATAARMTRVLVEVGLAGLIPEGPAAETIRVRRGVRVELDRSPAFRSYSEIRNQATECLNLLTSRF
jgi:single-stranded-DNA-specific exonuclease